MQNDSQDRISEMLVYRLTRFIKRLPKRGWNNLGYDAKPTLPRRLKQLLDYTWVNPTIIDDVPPSTQDTARSLLLQCLDGLDNIEHHLQKTVTVLDQHHIERWLEPVRRRRRNFISLGERVGCVLTIN